MGSHDEGVEAVRRAREAISREHDNDPRKLVEYYMTLQARHEERLIEAPNQRAGAAGRPETGR